MKHEKPESHPDDYKPQCECSQPKRPSAIKTERCFFVGYAERKPDGTVRKHIALGDDYASYEAARIHIDVIKLDYERRRIAYADDEFCVIEHVETFWLV